MLLNQVRGKARKEHYPAPYAMIDIWAADGASPRTGFESEARSFADLMCTSTAKNLIRVFFLQSKLKGQGKIGVRVGRVVNKYKMAKHFRLTIEKDTFRYRMNRKKIDREALLDGIYVIRTSLSKRVMNAVKTVLTYKMLSEVEQAFIP